jgi:magnesium chelatase family protein
LHEVGNNKESAIVQSIVNDLRSLQYERTHTLNSALSSQQIQTKSNLTEAAKKQLQQFAEKLKLSPRSYLRTIKVSRTIADLDHSDTIEERHILEALQYRPKLD